MLEPEPAVGIALRFMFPNGLSINRIFISDVSHQDVYRFVGCQESTPRHFILKYHSSGGIRELDGSSTIDGNLRLFVHPVASARVLRSQPPSTSATFSADHAYAASPFIPSTPLPEDSEVIALPAMESWYEDAGTPEVQIRRQRPLAHGSTLPVSQMENDSTPSSSHTQTRQEVQDR
ncbi:PREDICTED: uncharacterized protein LOC106818470 [Priapulus caudatus]|uniref:Uncharacterized protein LOC106818470 n=1 Tax=Priapulus caudatus TaxID=37621 RepID=A0ABM1F2I9_PRICU|nr:PREDICTED: uncharacterized protein LOC106818470 [Priapulus caudatus]